MRSPWVELEAFAPGGNALDPALGSVTGTAFASVVDGLAGAVVTRFVAAVLGRFDVGALASALDGAEIGYGAFIMAVVDFLLLALVLSGLVELVRRVGPGDVRAQGGRECPCGEEFVAVDATTCGWCPADTGPGQVDDDDVVEPTTSQRIAAW